MSPSFLKGFKAALYIALAFRDAWIPERAVCSCLLSQAAYNCAIYLPLSGSNIHQTPAVEAAPRGLYSHPGGQQWQQLLAKSATPLLLSHT